jgi:sortase A
MPDLFASIGTPRRRPRRWLERLLLLVGAAALTWVALLLVDARLAQQRALATLDAPPFEEADEEVVTIPDVADETLVAPTAAPVVPAVPVAAPIAELSIPRLHLSAAVLQGADAHTLRRGPGHVVQSALPGGSGNVVIAGHRDTFFRPLQYIQVGDDIDLRTPTLRIRYRVTAIWVVGSREISVLRRTDSPTLTLITCYPFRLVGNAPDRFVVRAEPVAPMRPAADDDGPIPEENDAAWTITTAHEDEP